MSGIRGNNGWLEAAIAWEVCASLHRQYCKGKDALFTTRQSDFVKHAEDAREYASRGQAPAQQGVQWQCGPQANGFMTPQADSQPAPIDPAIAADLERSDWTPEEALRWYAAGKHYDTVPNGDGSSSARILDNGAVASNALKSLSRGYAEHKGDVALQEPAPVVGTIAHVGTGKTTLTGAIASALRAAPVEQPDTANAALPDDGEPWHGHRFKEVQHGCWKCDCGKTLKEVTADQAAPATGDEYPLMPRRYTVDDDGEDLFTAEKMRAFADATHALRLASRGQAPTGAAMPCLHPKTADLVQRFSTSLAEKLAAAEKKYGYSDGWASPDWMGECRLKLREHLLKGDPRDVAAYCAFLWHHDESTALPIEEAEQLFRSPRTPSVLEDAALSQAARDVLAERQRQINAEGWTPEHDDEHGDRALCMAAVCYVLGRTTLRALEWSPDIMLWPWEKESWKPKDPRQNLIKAGALILAELERIDRAAMAANKGGE